MKTIIISIIALMIFSNLSLGQSKVDFGIEAGLVVPTGSTSDKYGTGYGAGAFVIIPTSSTIVSIMAGADYLSMPGTTNTEYLSPSYTITTTYEDLQVGSIYVGPKIGSKDGIYFLPAISFNFSTETRFGFYIGGGYLIPLQSVKLHLGARYGILNVIGKDENEDSEAGIGIFAGIVF